MRVDEVEESPRLKLMIDSFLLPRLKRWVSCILSSMLSKRIKLATLKFQHKLRLLLRSTHKLMALALAQPQLQDPSTATAQRTAHIRGQRGQGHPRNSRCSLFRSMSKKMNSPLSSCFAVELDLWLGLFFLGGSVGIVSR